MSEAAMSTPASFADYLADRYGLALTQRHFSDVLLLIEEDHGFLRLALYKFEDAAMKRKASSQECGLDKEKTLFLFDLQEAARKRRAEPSASSRPSAFDTPSLLGPSLPDAGQFDESYEKSDCSLDSIYLQFDLSQPSNPSPSPSQPRSSNGNSNSNSNSNSPCQVSTNKSTPTTTALPTPVPDLEERWPKSVLVGDCDEFRRHPARWDLLELPFTIQYILLNLVASGHVQWSTLSTSIVEEMMELRTSVEIVRKLQALVPSIEKYFTSELLQVCQDMDREEELLRSGSKYLYCQKDNWIGGKVRFSGALSVRQDKTVRVQLKAPIIRSSSRFTRRFGSSRFLHLSFAKSSKGKDALGHFFSEPLLLANRAFKLVCVKEGKAAFSFCLFQLGEDMPDIWSLYDWHSPWQINADALLAKHIARIHLGLSTSVPGPLIPAVNVRQMRDVTSKTGVVMTDGAAPISQAAMRSVASSLGLLDVPAAIQGRYDGAKGIWYISPERDDDDELWIGIRPSQKKYKREQISEECHQVLDVLQVSRINTPSSLNKQIMPILTNNGVPHLVLLQMQEKMLEQLVTDLLGERDNPKDGMELAKAMDTAGNLTRTRAKRVAPHLALVHGLSSRAAEDLAEAADIQESNDDDDTSDGSNVPQESASAAVYMSVFEKAYEMLLTGFSVGTSKMVSDLTVQAAKALLDRHRENCKMVVDRSAEALIIPDPCGVLEEGEIQLRFGRHAPVDPSTGMRINALTGSVLVTRLPCLIATDVQKVTAVVYPELTLYHDVIIFSTKGETPLADALSGGDYDGDLVRVIWEPGIVTPFLNADADSCRPSMSLDDVFYRDRRLVSELCQEQTGDERERQLNTLLKNPLISTGMKGSLGKLHSVAAYMHGISSKEAIDLAFKFNQSMDGVKTGYTLRQSVVSADKKRFDLEMPAWAGYATGAIFGENLIMAKRHVELGAFIMDELAEEIRHVLERLNIEIEKRQQETSVRFAIDNDLVFRWEEAKMKGTLTEEQQAAMVAHCKDALQKLREAGWEYQRERVTRSASPQKRGRTRQDRYTGGVINRAAIPAYYRRWMDDAELLAAFAGSFRSVGSSRAKANSLDRGEIERLDSLLASCLYTHAVSSRGVVLYENKAFDIAWTSLLNLKADAQQQRERPGTLSLCVSYPTSTVYRLRLAKRT